jgi:hypothetical protein
MSQQVNPVFAAPSSEVQGTPPRQNPQSNPVHAYVLHALTLRDAGRDEEFQKFMLAQLLPSINTSPEDDPDQHTLLGGDTGNYVCLSRLSYGVHQTPFPTWLVDQVEELTRKLQAGLKDFANVSKSAFYYDVAAWRHHFGMDVPDST